MPTFGEFIKSLRMERGFSQRQVGRCLGIGGWTVCNWEKDKYVPALPMMVKICNFFRISLDECAACSVLPGPRYIPPIHYKRQLGESLKELRDMNRMYLSDIGREMYIDAHTAMIWERGKVPTLDALLGYCKMFRVTLTQIFTETYPGNMRHLKRFVRPKPRPKQFVKPVMWTLGLLFYAAFTAAVIWMFTLLRRNIRFPSPPPTQYAVCIAQEDTIRPASSHGKDGLCFAGAAFPIKKIPLCILKVL